jgi:16S rRNA (cytosine967-C5)-methyltransferase
MAKTPRQIALEVINRVHSAGSYANILLPKKLAESDLDARDKAFVTELTYGTLRAKGTLDWIIKQFSKQKITKIPDMILDLIRMSLYQIFYMDVPDHAAVNEAVVIAKKQFHPGIASFVNGLLRGIIREKDNIRWPDKASDPAMYVSIKYFHPLWMVKLWIDEFGFDETEALCEANNRPPRLTIRANTLKITPSVLAGSLAKKGWAVEPGRYVEEALYIKGEVKGGVRGGGDLSRTDEFKKGLFYVQDESSMLISHMLDPQPGDAVLDVAAAPGGKTTHIAQLMDNRGSIIAVDSNPNRINLMKQNLERLGINIVLLLNTDAGKLKNVIKQPVDRILVDAPCSGLGVLARRPDARWTKTPEQITELSKIQTDILVSIADFVKPGGVLVYSVCTITEQETQLAIERFLRTREDFNIDDLTPYLPESLRSDVNDGMIQLMPNRYGIDGLFVARLQRED